MKNLILFIIAFATAACGNAQTPSCKITGTLKNQQNDTVTVCIANEQRNRIEKEEKVVAVDGKFAYTAEIPNARIGLVIANNGGVRMQVYLLPGEELNVDIKEDGTARLGGSAIYKEIDAATSLPDKEQKGAYIKANPNSVGSLALLLETEEVEDFEKYDAVITDEVKQGKLATFYQAAKQYFEKEKERIAQMAKLAPGAMAPDFRLPTIDGKELSLSDLRGKYVIIDFWGSWCIWCIRGMPKMKEYYDKYNAKLEILGVDCRDKEDKWRAAVEQHKANWKHVRNGEGDKDITGLYAIQGYPTKVLVDPEGKIVKYMVGEDPKFYPLLDEVLK